MLENLLTLGLLVLLQAVLGFDNLLYISLESKRAPAERQSYVRNLGIGVAVFDPCANRPARGDFLSVMRENISNLRQIYANQGATLPEQ